MNTDFHARSAARMAEKKANGLFAIIAHTQVLENYGSPLQPRWKTKGGDAYWVANLEIGSAKEAQAVALNMDPVRGVETRDNPMMIEFVNRIEAITVEEARRRAAIDVNDPNIDPDTYFSAVKRADHYITTYKLGA
jgi:hypothetical protein